MIYKAVLSLEVERERKRGMRKDKAFEGNDGKRKLMIIEGPWMHEFRTKMMKKKTKTRLFFSLSL